MALGNGIASSVVHGADGGDGAMHCEGHMLEEGKVPYICPNHKKKKKIDSTTSLTLLYQFFFWL